MKILITGGSGYVARNITHHLKKNNHRVYSPTKTQMNVLDKSDIIKNLDVFQPDAIIHAASVGGHRNIKDDYTVYSKNINMFNNIINTCENTPIIFYTSGADCDRRFPINKIKEQDVIQKHPIDPYGLAKNTIVKQILKYNLHNIKILRIFAAFNHDELNTRFIKNSILNIKNNSEIIIHKNREMDFFYIDDLVTVTNYILTTKDSPNHINMSYKEKYTLYDIAKLICKHMNEKEKISIESDVIDNPYSGSGEVLNNLKLNLNGLDKGIYDTINKLI